MAIVGDKVRLPSSPGEYFNTARSPLNPYNQGFDGFAYGTLPLFLVRGVAELVDMASYDRIHLVGRALSALADLGTVIAAFLLGRLVYGTPVGLLAAGLLSVTVLHIQLSHFFAVDTFLTFFTTLALYAAYRAWTGGGLGSFALLGLAVGLAAGTKLSAALLGPIVALAALAPPPDGRARAGLGRLATSLGVTGMVAALVYRVAEPYSFAGASILGIRPNVQRFTDLDRWIKISSGEIEVPYMIQWAGTPNPWFALGNLVEWGFGPVAGLTALASLAVATLQLVRIAVQGGPSFPDGPRGGVHLILVAWCVLNLGYFGFQFAKFMRYFLPVYPALALLAAWFLVRLVSRAAPASLPVRVAARLAAPAVLGMTVLYVAMFASIYGRPNTRVEASEWIYANVPSGATLGVEHWDDALPLRLPGRDRRFAEVSMELYEEESRQKAPKLAENLARADYLILSSNRLYGSIARLPERYPIAVEYYRALFEGELGFELAVRFQSHPNLLGLSLDDSRAQEDFSVYDHPTVLIFRKADDFDEARARQRLAAVPLDQLQRTKPVDAGARGGLMLSPAEWRTARAGGTWSERFALDGLAASWPVPAWLLAIELIALASLPICWLLFPTFPDRGVAASKIIGLVLVSYVAWLAASLQVAPFGPALVLAALMLVAGTSCLIASREFPPRIHPGPTAPCFPAVPQAPGSLYSGASGFAISAAPRLSRMPVATPRRSPWPMLVVETIFLGAFGLMLAIRALNPDLWHSVFGGEKPMDFAYLNAVIRSTTFPPFDPWFAGGYINYYYYGFVLVAVPTLLAAVPPQQAYNLAIATIFAMIAAGASAFAMALVAGARRLARPRLARLVAAGLISAATLCLLGNLDPAVQARDALWRSGGAGVPSVLPGLTGFSRLLGGLASVFRGGVTLPFDFWRSTRFIGPEEPGPIHEFPFFTFLYGDLHAHMVALPIQVVVAMLALQLVRSSRELSSLISWRRRPIGEAIIGPEGRRALGLLAVVALAVGTLRATNTWDFPSYLLLAGGAGFLGLRAERRVGWPLSLAVSAALVALLYASSSLMFLPYLARYELFYAGVVPVRAATDVGQFLTIHGLFFAAVGGWLAVELVRAHRNRPNLGRRAMLGSGSLYSVLAPPITLAADTRLAVTSALILALGVALFAAGRGTIAIVGGLGLATGLAAIALRASPERLFALLMVAAALVALLVPELVAVRGDVGRMNTVFKFYLQAWVLLALLSGPAIVWTVGRLLRGRASLGGWGRVLVAMLLLCGLAAAVYPLRATPSKLGIRLALTSPTVDGMAYMEHARYLDGGRDLQLGDDYQGIRWMLEHVEGSPVILEGNTPLYHWGSRFSVYTGLPTVLGWDWHQKQQRWGYQSRVEQRQRDVKTAYETTDPETLRAVLAKYDVAYIVVGGVERAYYPAAGLEKFERLVGADHRSKAGEFDGVPASPSPLSLRLEVAYRAGELTIYRLVA